MKDLYSTLATLLHLEPYESKSLPEFLDLATTSLTYLKERVERLKAMKEELEVEADQNDETCNIKPRLKVIQMTESNDAKLEVNLIFMVDSKKSVIFKVLSAIEQGGAEIMSSSFSNVVYVMADVMQGREHGEDGVEDTPPPGVLVEVIMRRTISLNMN
ncbi:hypothetical protein R6Q57_011034 [Mikania cordata]